MSGRAAAVTVVIALALAGCGSSSSSPAQTVTAYFSAYAAGNGRKACDLLTPGQRTALQAQIGLSCVPAVAATAREIGTVLPHAKARVVSQSGTRANVRVAGELVRLTKTGSRWLIAGTRACVHPRAPRCTSQ